MGDCGSYRCCAVQGKISCVLKTVVKPVPSSKKQGQNYSVQASNQLSEEFTSIELSNARPTEKLDGTCCHVRVYHGKPVLWARLDRKPSKGGEKRFKAFQRKHREWQSEKVGDEPVFSWKFPGDLKTVPESWVPADDVTIDPETKYPIPDENGHVPGWVPVETGNPQYCWHSATVDYEAGIALTMKPATDAPDVLEIGPTPLSELDGKTLELIGTNVNGNPYALGTKSQPFHVLVEHGCVPVRSLPDLVSHDSLVQWFKSTNQHCAIEGIVWHFADGRMFKLHRCHLSLPWPIKGENDDVKTMPLLSTTAVQFSMRGLPAEKYANQQKSMFFTLTLLDNKCFRRFCEVFE